MKDEVWCANCKRAPEHHVDRKCLFDTTMYRPMTEIEYIRFCVSATESMKKYHQKKLDEAVQLLREFK